MGVAIWYVAAPWKRSRTDVVLMVFAFILTSMSPSDLFPAYLRKHYITPYALKALPCVVSGSNWYMKCALKIMPCLIIK